MFSKDVCLVIGGEARHLAHANHSVHLEPDDLEGRASHHHAAQLNRASEAVDNPMSGSGLVCREG